MSFPLISLEHVSLFINGHVVLQDVSYDVRPGRHLAIVGANGSGKSSLLRVCTGELWPNRDQGRRVYSLDGFERTQSPLLVRPAIRRIAPEMQERFLRLGLPLSVTEFVASGIADRDYAQPADLDEARVAVWLDRLGLRRVAAQQARTLSHGMLRRAYIARALIAEPRILALDEITDGLDGESRTIVYELLERCVDAGTTLLCVAHRIEKLPHGIREFVRLDAGRLTSIDMPAAPPYASRNVVDASAYAEAPPAAPIVTLDRVSVRFGDTVALHDVSYTVHAGRHIAIIGDNGAGKSTFAGVLDGTYLPSSGCVLRHEYEHRPSIWEIRRAMVTLSDALQVRHDWMCSVRDTIASGFSQSIGFPPELNATQKTRVAELLARFSLHEFATRELPTLSFGQRRRVLLARALVHAPRVLILDEVFDGLDQATRVMLDAELHALSKHTTIVCITHVAEEIPAFIERRIVMRAGAIREQA